jgi:hypothetical protein
MPQISTNELPENLQKLLTEVQRTKTPLTNFGGLSPLPLQAARFGSGSKSPSQNVIANCELRIANCFNCYP